ncbi:DNA polymerase I [bacterium]|nr:DNA polymerase I [candidate division CSSED10-310 bacterium]
MTSKPKLYVIDGHNLLYKAHFTFLKRPLINSKGRDVSVSYGFTRMLIKLLKEKSPEYITIAFDKKGPTFRHAMYEQYKLNRPPMPACIADNLIDVKSVVKAFGIQMLEQEGYEADDIIGSIALRLGDADVEICLVTSDKDMLQLVSDNVSVLAAKKGLSEFVQYDRADVFAKYGVPPEKMIDYFAIVGDAIDNVPGVHGIGPKGAAKLLNEFTSLEDILDHSDAISSEKIKEKIEQNRQFALLSKKLIELKKDAVIPNNLESYRIKERDSKALMSLFKNLEFMTLIDELSLKEKSVEKRSYHIIRSKEELLELGRQLRQYGRFVYDVETTSLDPLQAEIVGFSVAVQSNEAFYVPVGHHTAETQADVTIVKQIFDPIFKDPSVSKIGHNMKYDWIVSQRSGIDLKGVAFDTMVASYLLNPGKRQHNLDSLALEHLGIAKIPTTDLIGKSSDNKTMDLVPLDTVSEYACEDADVTFRLWEKLRTELESREQLRLFNDIEMPLIEVLKDMELTGIRVDAGILAELSKEVSEKLNKIEEEIYILSGETFNINSTQQLSRILFEKLQYPVKGIKKTKAGYSTAESELVKLASMGGLFNELPNKILEYRSYSKLKSTYLDALPEMVNPNTKRIHSSFNQTVTETGRLSSSNPNLQNIPIRTDIGKAIRKAFIASEQNVLISADYSQMELRILAHIAKDEALIEAFKQDRDIHAATASTLFGVSLDKVTDEQRRRAKMVNFGIDYGMTPFGLSERLGISVQEAKRYIEKYLNTYRGVKAYIQSIQDYVVEYGWVETLMGRRRYIPAARDERRQNREAAFRQAINMPIQGSASDVIKIAMISIYKEFRNKGLKTKMVLQIHDELLFDAPPRESDEVCLIVKSQMENAVRLEVPLKVDIRVGANWAEIH